MPNDTTPIMTPEEIEATRVAVRQVMDDESLPQTLIAREVGMPYGTLTAWLGGSYQGRNDLKAAEVQKWLRARKVRAETQAMAPAAPRFVATPTAGAFLAIFQQAQHMPDFAVVVGAPGVGKSSSACHYTRTNPNVFKIVAHPILSSPKALLEELSRVIGTHQAGALHRIQRGLVQKLRGTNALIMVDEAQHLTPVALDQLRSIHDEAEIGIVLLGNPAVYGRLEGQGRSAQFAQLFSRVGMRMSRPKPQKGDIDALLDAWAVEGATERQLLHTIARKPGALRGMTKALKLAHMLAAADKARPDASHIREAYERLSSTDLTAEAA